MALQSSVCRRACFALLCVAGARDASHSEVHGSAQRRRGGRRALWRLYPYALCEWWQAMRLAEIRGEGTPRELLEFLVAKEAVHPVQVHRSANGGVHS